MATVVVRLPSAFTDPAGAARQLVEMQFLNAASQELINMTGSRDVSSTVEVALPLNLNQTQFNAAIKSAVQAEATRLGYTASPIYLYSTVTTL